MRYVNLLCCSNGTKHLQSVALRDAIREYEANKWKAIGQKLGKPAKVGTIQLRFESISNKMEACEQYAKEHFKNM
jgi:hypothetical protein